MEQIAVFEDKVMLTPADLSREITSFDDILLQKNKYFPSIICVAGHSLRIV